MVTVHRAFGLRFAILTDDHEPAHVHVIGDGEMKVEIAGEDGLPTMVWSVGFKRSQRRRIMDEVRANQSYLLERWVEMHGSITR
jgi:hypothetical protein